MKKVGKVLYWTPRLQSILYICFLTLFSFDVFEQGKSVGEILLGLLIHNIPSIILIILLLISWRKEIVGAVGYFVVGLIYIGLVIFNVIDSGLPWYLAITWSITIAAPALLIGVLFLINWKKRNKIDHSEESDKFLLQ